MDNQIMPTRNKAITLKAAKRAIKQRVNGRVGELAVYEVIISVEIFLDLLAQKATENLHCENELRKEKGLELRKTLQEIDIKNAMKSMMITK